MLKHQRDAVAAQPVERATGHADQFLTLEQRRSADDAIVRQQAEKAEHRLALARARFADDAEAAARLDLNADALAGLQPPASRAKGASAGVALDPSPAPSTPAARAPPAPPRPPP